MTTGRIWIIFILFEPEETVSINKTAKLLKKKEMKWQFYPYFKTNWIFSDYLLFIYFF
jgi:hypothetical protein